MKKHLSIIALLLGLTMSAAMTARAHSGHSTSPNPFQVSCQGSQCAINFNVGAVPYAKSGEPHPEANSNDPVLVSFTVGAALTPAAPAMLDVNAGDHIGMFTNGASTNELFGQQTQGQFDNQKLVLFPNTTISDPNNPFDSNSVQRVVFFTRLGTGGSQILSFDKGQATTLPITNITVYYNVPDNAQPNGKRLVEDAPSDMTYDLDMPPTQPGPPTLGTRTDTSITFTWTAATDPEGEAVTYRAYRVDNSTSPPIIAPLTGGSGPPDIAGIGPLSFIHTGLTAGTDYTYQITAFDPGRNESLPSSSATFQTLAAGVIDTTPPSQPTNLRVTGKTDTSITIGWGPATDPAPGTGIDHYNVYADGAAAISVATTSLTFTQSGLSANSTHVYVVRAVDTEGNESLVAGAPSVTATTLSAPDTTPPSQPTNLRITGKTNTSITFAWDASTDAESGMDFYNIYRTGSPSVIATVSNAAARLFQDTGLTPSTAYTYTVTAVDRVANESLGINAPSVTATTLAAPDGTPPSIPVISQRTVTPTSVVLEWPPSTDVGGSGVAFYYVYRDGIAPANLVGTITATTGLPSFTNTGLSPSTSYVYRVSAADSAFNTSASSAPLTVTTPATADTTPPTTPANLVLVSRSDTTITFSWTAATDGESGIARYYVYRDGTTINQRIATVTSGTRFHDTQLQLGATHAYRVQAENGQGIPGQLSGPESFSTLATADTTPPTAPGALTLTVVSDTAITLSWAAATDSESFISSYNMYRAGSLVASVTGTTYADTGLTPDTSYLYVVEALNGQGLTGPRASATARTTNTTVTTTTTTTTTPTTTTAAGSTPIVRFASNQASGGATVRPSAGGGSVVRNSRIIQLLRGNQPSLPDGTIATQTPQAPEFNCLPDLASLSRSKQRAVCFLYGKAISGKPVLNERGQQLTDEQGNLKFIFDGNSFLQRSEIAKILSYMDFDFKTSDITSREDEVVRIFKTFYPYATLPKNKGKATLKYSDVPQGEWFAPSVFDLTQNRVVSGYGGTADFGPSNKLVRVELEKMALRYVGYVLLADDPKNIIVTYLKNFKIQGEWWLPYAAFSAEFLSDTSVGSDILPGNKVTRADAVEYFVAVLELVQNRYQQENKTAVQPDAVQ